MRIFWRFFLGMISLIIFLVILFFVYINWPVKEKKEMPIELGVTFSARYAQDINLNWQDNFLAILDDLGAKKIRIPVYWDLVEKTNGQYDFSQIDWQLAEAEKRQAKIILTIGQKVPRWPECFIPAWAKENDELRKEKLIEFITVTVNRYKNNPTVKYWQVENEPFLNFGVCPTLDVNLLDQELATVRALDSQRKIIVTDSGELSFWVSAAKRADIFGTTMYRKIWNKQFGYFDYPIGPKFFQLKRTLINYLANQPKAIVVELQGEPWVDGWTIHAPLATQFQSMNPEILKDNVIFAKKSGFFEAYLWGVEWWWWLKVKENQPQMWDTAKELFEANNQ